ncbi:Superoxide dismutase [Mn], mitochondrial [Mycoemilia scoparia]|uniref:Superoxide dismutase n=1 Tax=Mycoemilia scoparia TaxID=417184 RepID=A0A9W7ZQR3_9FUNG|nr:Superoxide dismutase [Mn], mitochondrial [Mycoemilia scoparia]
MHLSLSKVAFTFASTAILALSSSTHCAASSEESFNITPSAGKNYTLPPLPYAYNALEPVISEQIMKLHHDKHHKAYVDGLNTALTGLSNAKDADTIASLQSALHFNSGGHINHSIFWKNMRAPREDNNKSTNGLKIDKAIKEQFGSTDKLTKLMQTRVLAIQGSGWCWLVLDPATQKLDVITLPNQDTPGMVNKVPLLGIDIWEHAFYLDYLNVKADYVTNFWKVVNWDDVNQRYENAVSKSKN